MIEHPRHHCGSTGLFPRPREFLKTAETMAARLRRSLRQVGTIQDVEGCSVSSHDALAIAELIVDLCRFGRRAQAADAIMIAERVEVLLDQLGTEIDFILACRNHRALE